MLAFIEITTIIISIIYSIKSLRNMNRSSIYVYQLIFNFITVIPLILDYIMGYPTYTVSYPGFSDACFDTSTRMWYCVYIIMTQIIVMTYAKRKKQVSNLEHIEYGENLLFENSRFKYVLTFVAMIVPIGAIIVGMPASYMFSWAWRYDQFDTSSIIGYGALERISYVGVIAAIIIFLKCKNLFLKFFTIVLLYINICIQGKRSAVFFAVAAFVICYIMMKRNRNKKWIIWLFVSIAALFIVNVSFLVQSNYRDFSGFDEMYRMLRVDLFRDDTIKSSIYAMLNPKKMQILEYPGQSAIMQIGYLFPLIWLGVPKVGYETYMTAALKYVDVSGLINDVRMTVSIFDCLIANFSFLGLIMGSLFIIFYGNLTDKKSLDTQPIFICGFLLYSMYSWGYICWYFEFWIIVIWCYKHIRIRKDIR